MNEEDFASTIDRFLRGVIRNSGLQLNYRLEPSPPGSIPILSVQFEGADVPLLLGRNAELLFALEHFGAKAVRLDPEEHDLLSFDAAGFKRQREHAIAEAAALGVRKAQQTGRPYHFAPMSSRERRLLHLAIAALGTSSHSQGEGRLRRVVITP